MRSRRKTHFLEFHLLTSHAPSNLNRDELGTPKTAVFGGDRRLRISSQCLKRTWRTSPLFAEEMEGQHAVRTRYTPERVYQHLVSRGIAKDRATEVAEMVIALTRKEEEPATREDTPEARDTTKKGKPAPGEAPGRERLQTPQLVLIGHNELDALEQYCLEVSRGKQLPSAKDFAEAIEAKLASTPRDNVDLALFGRMVTSNAIKDIDSALQVADAISTHKVELEFDYFTAVDDLETESKGAGHIGEAEFASAVFYKYAVCALESLCENLGGHGDLAAQAVATLLRPMCLASPSGKQNAHAAHNPADYVLVRLRQGQPMSLANAFAHAVWTGGKRSLMRASIEALEDYLTKLNAAYDEKVAGTAWVLLVDGATTLAAVECVKALSELTDRVKAAAVKVLCQ